jgi:hypothetical protein
MSTLVLVGVAAYGSSKLMKYLRRKRSLARAQQSALNQFEAEQSWLEVPSDEPDNY